MNLVSIAWNNFKVSYIATDSSLSYFMINYIDKSFTAQPVVSGTGSRTYGSYFTLSSPIDDTHDISILPFLTGIKISTAGGGFSF